MSANTMAAGTEALPKKRGLWQNAWKRLKRNKRAMVGMYIMLAILLLAIFAPVIAPYGYDDQVLTEAFQSPSLKHLCGTDNFGRDVFSRLLYGGRISLTLGLIAVALSTIVGIIVGAISGYYGGAVDNLIMRCMDIMQSIPSILLAIAIASTLGGSMVNCMIAIGISSVPLNARLMRGMMLSVRQNDYVEAARCANASDLRIMFREIIPNAMSPMIVNMTLGYAGALLNAAALSFIGLGAQPPSPEWGAMITAGKTYITRYPYLITAPGIAIMLTVISLNLFGDGIRDALDPKMKQ